MTPTRRATRIALLVVAIPLFLVSLLVAVKLASLTTLAGAAISRYQIGAYELSAESADALMQQNLFEPWIAHFDRGTARAAQGLYNEAIEDLENAFAEAPDDRRCDVALNLSLSWESLGDQYLEQGEFAGALKLYGLAEAALDAVGDGCGGPTPTDGDRDRAAPEPRARLDAKQEQAQALEDQSRTLDDQEPGAPLERLREQNDDAAREKEAQRRQREALPGQPAPGDKPW